MSLRSVRLGLRRLFDKQTADRELDDEIAHLVEMAAAEYTRRGMTRADAVRAARLDFSAAGGVEGAKEAVRAAGWESYVDTLSQDVRYAWRGLKRTPAFTLVAVVTLALGIGANTAMFSVVNAVMLRPLPYADAGRLAFIWTDDTRRGLHQEGVAFRTIEDWRQASRSFDGIAYFAAGRTTLAAGDVRERSRAAFVSGNVFQTLGVAPAAGRVIGADDEASGAEVAVISYGLWQRRFGGAADVVGKTVTTEDGTKGVALRVARIVGVMPAGFYFPDKRTEIWRPSTTYWRFRRESTERHAVWARRWTAVGRLRPGISADAARAELASIGRRLSVAYPTALPDFPGFSPTVMPVLDYVAGRNLQFALWVLLGAVGLVLLVACANVANLQLARAAARHHEFAVRRALGAGRCRLVRQLLVESGALAMIGGAAGLLLAYGGTRLLAAVAVERVPRVDEIAVDWRVLLFVAAVSAVAGCLFGLVPALRLSRASDSDALKEGTRTSGSARVRRTRGMLVVAECSMAIVLLAGAGLLLRSLARVRSVTPGFDASSVLMMRMEFPTEPTPAGDEHATEVGVARGREQLLHDLAGSLAAMPGVEDVGVADDLFITGQGNRSIVIGGRPSDSLAAGELAETSVSPSFFSTMRVPVLRGRTLTRDDALTKIRALYFVGNTDASLSEKERLAVHEPVVVNDAFVKRYLRGEDPIGKTFCIDPTNKTYWYVIVGVVGDLHQQGLEHTAIPQYYTTYVPSPGRRADVLLRTAGNPSAVAASARGVVAAHVPRALIPSVSTVDRELGGFSAQRTFQTWLLTLFAALAVALAAVGIYGVVHYAVAERTREIGVRIALGAAPGDVAALVVRQGMLLPIVGVAIGLVLAFGATRFMSHLLFGVAPTDLATFAGVAIALVAVALAACCVPARRATRVDPVSALRRE